jgi:hypothetical protein
MMLYQADFSGISRLETARHRDGQAGNRIVRPALKLER